jgi:hypothetical protein
MLRAVDFIDHLESEGVGRRAFLGLLGLGAVALLPGGASALGRRGKKKLVYRLSSRGCSACHACKAHAANRYYRTQEAADADRAHVGCHCKIVSQRIPRRLAKRYFKGRDVYDVRWEETV